MQQFASDRRRPIGGSDLIARLWLWIESSREGQSLTTPRKRISHHACQQFDFWRQKQRNFELICQACAELQQKRPSVQHWWWLLVSWWPGATSCIHLLPDRQSEMWTFLRERRLWWGEVSGGIHKYKLTRELQLWQWSTGHGWLRHLLDQGSPTLVNFYHLNNINWNYLKADLFNYLSSHCLLSNWK